MLNTVVVNVSSGELTVMVNFFPANPASLDNAVEDNVWINFLPSSSIPPLFVGVTPGGVVLVPSVGTGLFPFV